MLTVKLSVHATTQADKYFWSLCSLGRDFDTILTKIYLGPDDMISLAENVGDIHQTLQEWHSQALEDVGTYRATLLRLHPFAWSLIEESWLMLRPYISFRLSKTFLVVFRTCQG